MGVRAARADDADAIAAIYAPIVRDTPISFEVDPPSRDEMRRRITTIGAVTPWLVCTAGEQLAGYAYASGHRERAAYRWSVDVAVYVHEEARGHGVGTALYHALLAMLSLQGFHRAHAGITLPNAGSVRLHESAGFTPVGVYHEVGFKLGAWHDVGWWARDLAPAALSPGEPLRFAEIAHSEAVVSALASAPALVRGPIR